MDTNKLIDRVLSNNPGGARVSSGRDSRQDWATPWSVISACEKRFGPIMLDLAATEFNTKAPTFITPERDSLSPDVSWIRELDRQPIGSVAWLNPPFKVIGPWAEKCLAESRLGARILLLTSASVDSNWFAAFVHGHALVLAINPRLTFEGTSDPYPKPLMLSCFGFGAPGFDVWRWRP